MTTYYPGQRLRLAVVCSLDGVATDPTALTLKLKDPDGTTITYTYGTDPEIVKDVVGNYHADHTFDHAGDWWWRWTATGTVAAPDEGYVGVLTSAF